MIMEDTIESSNIVEPVANVEPQETENIAVETTESVKEEVAPSQEIKAQQTAEENAKYASIRREAESKARDKTIADMGMSWNGEKIATYEQYQKAKVESDRYEQEQKIRSEYEAKGVPDELLDELVESKRDREERNIEKQAKAEQDKQSKDYVDFLDYFKKENDRSYDAEKDTIPTEVWQQVFEGKSLKDAYTYHLKDNLKSRIAELESKLKANETNKANAEGSTGSVTGNGNGNSGFISFETFEANKNNQRWVVDNLSKISESRAKW
jgi:hypothetical protein